MQADAATVAQLKQVVEATMPVHFLQIKSCAAFA